MSTSPKSNWLWYVLTLVVMAGLGAGVTALLMNIQQRKHESELHFISLVGLDEDTVDAEKWGVNFPRQYATYKLTADNQRTRHGGNEALDTGDKLLQDPFLKTLYAGYAFSIDYRDKRGHAYMLIDQENTRRVKERKQPGACLHCHASVMPMYRQVGGGSDWEHVKAGFEKACGMDWSEAHQLAGNHPVSCVDCHDPRTAQLRISRPAFLIAIQTLARENSEPLPHLPSLERWRQGDRKADFNVNVDASRQELRSLVCAQCHVEYYFKPDTKVLTYPWANGLRAGQIEKYYDAIDFKDWVHADTGARVLKAQHPEFELWSQGIHARSGVACADCHMPYMRDGAVKISDHQVRSPMLNVSRACVVCHRFPEDELQARVEAIQGRTQAILKNAEAALGDLIGELTAAKKASPEADGVKAAQELQRKAQWRLDFILAENSRGFHAPQEAVQVLSEAIDFARQGQLALRKRD